MISPYRRPPKHRQVALLCADSKVLCEDGRRRWAPDPRVSTAVYTDHTRATHVTTSGTGKLVTWGGRPIHWVGRGFKSYILKGIHDLPFGDDGLLEALIVWRDWVESFGAGVSSVGSTSMSVFRTLVDTPVYLGGLLAPPIKILCGGRQYMGHPSGTFDGPLTHWDLSGAYPAAMRNIRVGKWTHMKKVDLNRIADYEADGHATFVGAKVRILETDRADSGPLPDHLTQPPVDPLDTPYYPSSGVMTHIWTGPEILAAVDTGSSVTPIECWVSDGPQPFIRFVDSTSSGRELPGFAAHLGKMTRNALWGQFAIVPQKMQTLTFESGERKVSSFSPGYTRPKALDLAETITGRVRAKLYRELIWSAQAALLAAHTDGGWVWADQEGWSPPGEGWRVKDTADVLDLLNPQSLAYLPYEGGEVRYVMAGIPTRVAPRVFAERWRSKFRDETPGVYRGRRKW